ncbi:biotin/lipoyl-binding protein [Paracoccus aerius]
MNQIYCVRLGHDDARAAAFLVPSCLSAGPPAAAQDDLLRVEMVSAEERPVALDLQLSGSITATDSVQMSFRQPGRVTGVLVDRGDRVRQGQELARLDSVQQDQALRVAEAGLAAAQAGLSQARQASDRAEALLSRASAPAPRGMMPCGPCPKRRALSSVRKAGLNRPAVRSRTPFCARPRMGS